MFVNPSRRIPIFLKCESCEQSLESEKVESLESGSHYVGLILYVRAGVVECEKEKQKAVEALLPTDI